MKMLIEEKEKILNKKIKIREIIDLMEYLIDQIAFGNVEHDERVSPTMRFALQLTMIQLIEKIEMLIIETKGKCVIRKEVLIKQMKINYKGYEISQVSNNHIVICKDNKRVFHSQCNRKLNEEELKRKLDLYLKLKVLIDEADIIMMEVYND